MLSRLEYSKHFLIVIFLAFFISAAWVSQSLSSVKISSSSIAITADGKTLLVVNPDSNSLTLIDTIQNVKLKEISVGIRPNAVAIDHINQRAYIANQGSRSISVINLNTDKIAGLC